MSALTAYAVALVLLATFNGPAAQWKVTHAAPFAGSSTIGSTTSGGPASMSFINATSFSFTTGIGGETAKGSLGTLGSGYLQSLISLELNLSFKNHSGTRALRYVNFTFDWSMVANGTYFPGVCPWNSTLKLPNECYVYVAASDWISLPALRYGSPTRPLGTIGNCISGCGRAGPGASVGAFVDEKNSSKGLRVIFGSLKAGTFSTSTSARTIISYTLSKNVLESTEVHLFLTSIGNLTTILNALPGRGGIPGAHISAYLDFDIKIVSITES